MKIVELNKITILQFDNLSNFHNIRHFVTTRKGGCSNNQYESLNLGFGTEDETGNVLKNRILLSEELGIPPEVAFRIYGFLSSVPKRTEQHENLLNMFDLLNEQD